MARSRSHSQAGNFLTVRMHEKDPDILLTISLLGKTLNFARKKDDLIETVLKRMRLNCGRALSEGQGTKKHGKEATNAEEVQISFLSGEGTTLPDQGLTMEYIIKSAHTFVLNSTRYGLIMNPPAAKSVSVLHPLVAECPVFVKIEVDGGLPEDLDFEYSVGDRKEQSIVFTPSCADSGHSVSLCVSNRLYPELFTMCAQPTPKVLPKPPVIGSSIPEKLEECGFGDIRIATWNLLAQGYVATHFAKTVMYPHVKDEAHLSFAYRNGLIFRDLLNFTGDLLLLQEVTPAVVDLGLGPILRGNIVEAESQSGADKIYDVLFACKEKSTRPNGVALVSRKSKLKLVEYEHLTLAGEGLWTWFTLEERETISRSFGSDFVNSVVPNLSTVANVAVYRMISTGEHLIVANTHLFYHPLAAHVRLLQTIALVRCFEKLLMKYPGAQVTLGGDLNSRSSTAVIRFLLTGGVDEKDFDWGNGRVFKWEGEDEAEEVKAISHFESAHSPCLGISVSHSIALKCTFENQIPNMTHATASFTGVLDYIFVSEKLKVTRNFKELHLTEDVIAEYGGLPNEAYGSDHVMVAAELSL